MGITPVQGVVYSAIAQKTSLSAAGGAVLAASDAGTIPVVPDVTIVPNISTNLIASSSLYNASLDAAQFGSQLQVAETGVQQIADVLQNLQNIANAILNGGDGTSLAALETQFQSLYSQINTIVANTSFAGKVLLNGSFALDNGTVPIASSNTDSSVPVIPDLSTQGLFGAGTLDITPDNAGDVLAAIGNAQDIVNGAADSIQNATDQINFIIASIETAQANDYASASTLSESDLSSSGFVADLLSNPSSSADTQVSNLSEAVSQLLSE